MPFRIHYTWRESQIPLSGARGTRLEACPSFQHLLLTRPPTNTSACLYAYTLTCLCIHSGSAVFQLCALLTWSLLSGSSFPCEWPTPVHLLRHLRCHLLQEASPHSCFRCHALVLYFCDTEMADSLLFSHGNRFFSLGKWSRGNLHFPASIAAQWGRVSRFWPMECKQKWHVAAFRDIC